VVNKTEGFVGIKEERGTILCPLFSKNLRIFSLIYRNSFRLKKKEDGILLVMIVHINNFNSIFLSKNKKGSIFPIISG
jgi:hypothetical protein